MNTLNKEITKKFYESESGYEELVKRWSELVNNPETNKTLTAEHHMLYAVLRGKDWRRCFTLPTNENKVVNGHTPVGQIALSTLKSNWSEQRVLAPFQNIITSEGLKEVRKYLPASFDLSKDAYKESV